MLNSHNRTEERSTEDIILEPYTYLISQPGKDIRAKLISAFDLWLHVPKDILSVINKIIGMLHNASLMIDDVQDDSDLRRGVPVAHHIYGVPQTINTANYVIFLALQEVMKLNVPSMMQVCTEELINLHRGQGIELYWRDSLTCPTEEEYIDMVNNSIHFQVRDDYMNLQSTSYTNNKGFCEDLTEGKFSFPIIHAIRKDPSNRQLLNIISQKPTSIEVKKYALEVIRKAGSFEYVREFLRQKENESLEEIKRLGGNPLLEKYIETIRMEATTDQ
ncbi:hypothetical protein MBANPS3_009907 [Mucor bainieri]